MPPDGPPETAVGILARAGLGTGGVENYARVEDAPGDLRAAWGSDTVTKEG